MDDLMTVVLMSRPEAEAITKAILDANETAWALVYRAYQGEAWRAMGYKSWAAYVDAELQISRGHSYHIEAVKAGASIGEAVEVVRAAAPLKKHHSGPRGLVGECEKAMRVAEALTDAFETAGDDALDHMDFDTRRTFERTAQRQYEFWSDWVERLSRPANPHPADDFEAA